MRGIKVTLKTGLWVVAFLAAFAFLCLTEEALRNLRKRDIVVEPKGNGIPEGLILTGIVKPDFLWVDEAYRLEIINNSDVALHNCMLEVNDGWHCPLGRLSRTGSEDMRPGESILIYWNHDTTNLDKFEKDGEIAIINKIPSRVLLHTDGGTYQWVLE